MNPIIMSMLVKAKHTEISKIAEKRRVFNENRQLGNRSDTSQILAFSLAAVGVIVLLVVRAIAAV